MATMDKPKLRAHGRKLALYDAGGRGMRSRVLLPSKRMICVCFV